MHLMRAFIFFFFRLELRAIYVIYQNDDEKYLNLEKSSIHFFYNIILLLTKWFSPGTFCVFFSSDNRCNGSAKFAISRMKTVCKNEKKTYYIFARAISQLLTTTQLQLFFSSNFCHNMSQLAVIIGSKIIYLVHYIEVSAQ